MEDVVCRAEQAGRADSSAGHCARPLTAPVLIQLGGTAGSSLAKMPKANTQSSYNPRATRQPIWLAMILRSCLRQRNGLLNAVCVLNRTLSPRSITPIRRKHTVPSLGDQDAAFKQNGIPGFYTPAGFQVAWSEYQGHIVEKLNEYVVGHAWESWDVKSIAVTVARDPFWAPLFNYASMAHNNHFYFKGLSNSTTEPSLTLTRVLDDSFSSMDSLRETFIETANAMFGPGFVWLVQMHHTSTVMDPVARPQFRILTTYLAGTPYAGAHNRQQPLDMNQINLQTTEEEYQRLGVPQNSVGAFGSSVVPSIMQSGYLTVGDSSSTRLFSGAECTPVLCVNTWQHAWMFDWGVGGKKGFLNRWWERIDWNVVEGNCQNLQPSTLRRLSRASARI